MAAGVSMATASKVLNGRGGRLRRHSGTGARGDEATAVLAKHRRSSSAGPSRRSPCCSTRTRPSTRRWSSAGSIASRPGTRGRRGGDQPDGPAPVRAAHSGTGSDGWRRRAHLGVIVVTTEVTPEPRGRRRKARSRRWWRWTPSSARDSDDDGLVSVGATNWTGGVQATEHLLNLGHRRIGFAGGAVKSQPARQRYPRPCRSAERRWCRCSTGPSSGRADSSRGRSGMAEELLASGRPPHRDRRRLRCLRTRRDGRGAQARAAPTGGPEHRGLRRHLRRRVGVPQAHHRAAAVAGDGSPGPAHGDVARPRRGPETHHFELATTLVVRDSTAPRV